MGRPLDATKLTQNQERRVAMLTRRQGCPVNLLAIRSDGVAIAEAVPTTEAEAYYALSRMTGKVLRYASVYSGHPHPDGAWVLLSPAGKHGLNCHGYTDDEAAARAWVEEA